MALLVSWKRVPIVTTMYGVEMAITIWQGTALSVSSVVTLARGGDSPCKNELWRANFSGDVIRHLRQPHRTATFLTNTNYKQTLTFAFHRQIKGLCVHRGLPVLQMNFS